MQNSGLEKVAGLTRPLSAICGTDFQLFLLMHNLHTLP